MYVYGRKNAQLLWPSSSPRVRHSIQQPRPVTVYACGIGCCCPIPGQTPEHNPERCERRGAGRAAAWWTKRRYRLMLLRAAQRAIYMYPARVESAPAMPSCRRAAAGARVVHTTLHPCCCCCSQLEAAPGGPALCAFSTCRSAGARQPPGTSRRSPLFGGLSSLYGAA